jgi:Cu-Zn family superoxide dismutase
MRYALGLMAIGALIAGCASMEPAPAPVAVADLKPTAGNSTTGTVTFAPKGDKVVVVAKLSGLAPGNHGFHVHEKGDCSAADAMSAGGHFNPLGKPHAHPTTMNRHAGDMPMLTADAAGNAMFTAELDVMTVGAGAADIVGKAVIVHKDPDDFTTQPTGNSGARVACGVIRKV